MAKFCKICGARLDPATGLCLNCSKNAAASTPNSNVKNSVGQNPAGGANNMRPNNMEGSALNKNVQARSYGQPAAGANRSANPNAGQGFNPNAVPNQGGFNRAGQRNTSVPPAGRPAFNQNFVNKGTGFEGHANAGSGRQPEPKNKKKKPTAEEKKALKAAEEAMDKAEKKQKKANKKAKLSKKQKARRLTAKIIAIILALAIVAGSVSCALVYFDKVDIPFIADFLDWIGLKKKETPESKFASVFGGFTDEKITDAESAIRAAKNASSQLGLTNATDELSLLEEDSVNGYNYYRLQENYNGLPVYGKSIVVIADENGNAQGITSNAVDVDRSINMTPTISDNGVSSGVSDYLDANGISIQKISKDALSIYYDEANDKTLLAYKLHAEVDGTSYSIFVNAHDGSVVECLSNDYQETQEFTGRGKDGTNKKIQIEKVSDTSYEMYDSARNIEVWTANGEDLNVDSVTYTYQNNKYTYNENTGMWDSPLPASAENASQYTWEWGVSTKQNQNGANKVTSSSAGFNNDDAVSAMYGAEKAYDFYKDVLGRKGYNNYNSKLYVFTDDNLGGTLNAYSHTEDDYMDVSFLDFSSSISVDVSVVGHEYTHAVEQSISGMRYRGFSGAIMEGYSDLFGEMIEDYESDKNLKGNTDWKIDEISRNIGDPVSTGNPAKYQGQNWSNDISPAYSKGRTTNDYGYVHSNSTVVSHAGYLMVKPEKSKYTALSIGKLAKLWYQTLYMLPSNCDFETLRLYMERTAFIAGYSDAEMETISAAFDAVGISKNVEDTAFKCSLSPEIKVLDKNGLAYDDYTIEVRGYEYKGLKSGTIKAEYSKDVEVDSSDPHKIKLPKGDYSITVIDNYSGNRSETKNVLARSNGDEEHLDYGTAFGCDYTISQDTKLSVYDVNSTLYGNYSVKVNGKDENGQKISIPDQKPDDSQNYTMNLSNGKYGVVLTDNKDSAKTKSFTVNVKDNSSTKDLVIKTKFGKPSGEFDMKDIPAGAAQYNGHYYYVYNVPEITTWEAAQEYCVNNNGYLATLTSKEENDFVHSLMTKQGFKSAYFGLHDTNYNEWTWITSEKLDYVNWAYGEPNSGSEKYGMFYETYTDGTWNDGDFGNYTSTDKSFICEWGAYESVAENIPDTNMTRTTSAERDIVLVLDVSGSMAGEKIEQTKTASKLFIDQALDAGASVAVVVYDDSAQIVSDFSMDRTALNNLVDGIDDGGSTNIDDGLQKAHDLLQYSGAEKRIIVLMSDGAPNSGRTGDELIAFANDIKSDGTYLYTLGFFGGYTGVSAEQQLMEALASEGCHYEVTDANSLQYFFGDIADIINGQQYYYIRIACPVDVEITYDGETLSSKDENPRTDFGTITFEENIEEKSESEYNYDDDEDEKKERDDRVKVVRLKADTDYDIQITGNGKGTMDYTIKLMDENGDYTDTRRFKNVKITRDTVIDTVAENTKSTVLKVDEDGDGKYDYQLKAKENSRGELVTYTWIIWLVLGIVGGVALIVGFFAVKREIRRRKHYKVLLQQK